MVGLNMNSVYMYPLPCLRYMAATENSLLYLGIDQILVQASTLHPYRLIPGPDKEFVVIRNRTAKTTEDLRNTAWRAIAMGTDVDISDGEFFCLDSLKRSEPVVFMVAAREWGVHLDLPGVIEDAAFDCQMPRKSQLRKQMANNKQ